MDITVEVMLPQRGAEDFNQAAHPKWRALTPVVVYPKKKIGTVGLQRTGFVQVTGVPLPKTWGKRNDEWIISRLNEILCQPHEKNLLVGKNPVKQTIEKRTWSVDPEALSAGSRRTLLKSRKITLTWPLFKAAMRDSARGSQLDDADLN